MEFTGPQPAPAASSSRPSRLPRPDFHHRLPALLVCLVVELVAAHLDLPAWIGCAALLLRFVRVSALTRATPQGLAGRVLAAVVDEVIGPPATIHCGHCEVSAARARCGGSRS